MDEEDYLFFYSLFSRHLSLIASKDAKSREYILLANELDLLAYCLLPNHFHLLIYQRQEKALLRLMMSVCTAYTMYFNKKYKRRGPLFENNYRASLISNELYLQHISRYIHLNPKDYRRWRYSSLGQYLGDQASPEWLKTQPILNMFQSVKEYADFVADYEEMRHSLENIKHELADNL